MMLVVFLVIAGVWVCLNCYLDNTPHPTQHIEDEPFKMYDEFF